MLLPDENSVDKDENKVDTDSEMVVNADGDDDEMEMLVFKHLVSYCLPNLEITWKTLCGFFYQTHFWSILVGTNPSVNTEQSLNRLAMTYPWNNLCDAWKRATRNWVYKRAF